MNRFIDKLIARHLEPAGNVKPLLTGVFNTVYEPSMTEMEEGVQDDETGQPPLNRPASGIREEGWSDREIFDGQEINHQPGARRSMSSAVPLVATSSEPGMGDGRSVAPMRSGSLQDKSQAPVEGEAKHIEKHHGVQPEEKVRQRKDMSGTLDSPAAWTGAVATKTASFDAPEETVGPVLQDLNEQRPMDQARSGKEDRETRITGVLQDNERPKVFPIHGLPVEAVRQTIHVSIGRIEIKALAPPVEVKVPSAKKGTEILGLDRFLEQRNPIKR